MLQRQSKRTGKPIAVIAGNYRQFRNYVDLHPNKNLFYADEPYKMQGLDLGGYVLVGTYYENPRIDELESMAKILSRPR